MCFSTAIQLAKPFPPTGRKQALNGRAYSRTAPAAHEFTREEQTDPCALTNGQGHARRA
jgi:hypothetical protein